MLRSYFDTSARTHFRFPFALSEISAASARQCMFANQPAELFVERGIEGRTENEASDPYRV